MVKQEGFSKLIKNLFLKIFALKGSAWQAEW